MEFTERIWLLVARSLNDEASSQEEEELFALLREDHSLHQQFELLKRIWSEKENRDEDVENARDYIRKIIERAEIEPIVEQIRSRRRKRFVFAVAASVLLVAFSIWLYINKSASQDQNDENILIAKNGSRTRSILPDGTTVWLNAGSRLIIESDFSGAREVRLEGEAFFDVVKKSVQPFIVHTGGVDIRVLGTAFNVKAYPEDPSVETTLLRGRIQVYDRDDSVKAPIELKPNEKLVLPKKPPTTELPATNDEKSPAISARSRFTITHIDSTKKENERIETAWVYSRFEFRGDRFEDLAHKMQRWYNVKIIFTDEKVKQLQFDGSFEKETVEEAMAALKTANLFTYQINKYEISVGSFK
jgi:transmembrane sensor